MKKTVCIVGINGNMGNRYLSICDYLGVDVVGYDYDDNYTGLIKESDYFIIATPTKTHFYILEYLMPLKKPILCEKPVVKNIHELEKIIEWQAKYQTPIYMVNQYAYYLNTPKELHSYYDYFKTGNDGLYWDCIQIIHLAKSSLFINNESPIWQCLINGVEYNIKDMDELYIKMVEDFIGLRKNLWDIKQIEKATRKVISYEENINRHTGQE